jgi:hypothetical protein
MKQGDGVQVYTTAKLVDKDQKGPVAGALDCKVAWQLIERRLEGSFSYSGSEGSKPLVIFPVISRTGEEVRQVNDHTVTINKEKVWIRVTANTSIKILPTTGGRVFNFVPGLEAVPLSMEGKEVIVKLEVLDYV